MVPVAWSNALIIAENLGWCHAWHLSLLHRTLYRVYTAVPRGAEPVVSVFIYLAVVQRSADGTHSPAVHVVESPLLCLKINWWFAIKMLQQMSDESSTSSSTSASMTALAMLFHCVLTMASSQHFLDAASQLSRVQDSAAHVLLWWLMTDVTRFSSVRIREVQKK